MDPYDIPYPPKKKKKRYASYKKGFGRKYTKWKDEV